MSENLKSLEQRMATLVRKYRNIPYKHNGRSLRGVDCLGLIVSVYEEFGLTVPSSDGQSIPKDWYKKDPDRYIRNLLKLGETVAREDLRVLDLPYFTLVDDIVTHAGVMINQDQFIHILQNRKVEVSSIERRYWRQNYAGARRLLQLDNGGELISLLAD